MERTLILPTINRVGIYNMEVVTKSLRPSPMRTTMQFEIELPIKNGGYNFINGIKYPVDTKRITCVKPNAKRYTKPPFTCYYIHFSLQEGQLYNALMGLPDSFFISDYQRYENYFKQMISFVAPDNENGVSFFKNLLNLCSAMIDECCSKQSGFIKPIENVISFINSHVAEKITLEDISYATGYAPAYIHRLFKKHVGQTPLDYLTKLRINKAKNLLSWSDCSLIDIAEQCGFANQTYFNSVFKKVVGITPLAFKTEYYKKYNP